jgi:hypothetical protein
MEEIIDALEKLEADIETETEKMSESVKKIEELKKTKKAMLAVLNNLKAAR